MDVSVGGVVDVDGLEEDVEGDIAADEGRWDREWRCSSMRTVADVDVVASGGAGILIEVEVEAGAEAEVDADEDEATGTEPDPETEE